MRIFLLGSHQITDQQHWWFKLGTWIWAWAWVSLTLEVVVVVVLGVKSQKSGRCYDMRVKKVGCEKMDREEEEECKWEKIGWEVQADHKN